MSNATPPPPWGNGPSNPGPTPPPGYTGFNQQPPPPGYPPYQGQPVHHGYSPMPSAAAPPRSFAEAVKLGFTHWSLRGRASRSEFWYWILFTLLASIGLGIVSAAINVPRATGPIGNLWNLFTSIATIKIAVRRYHDSNRSGGLLAAHLVGMTVAVVLAALGLLLAFDDALADALDIENGVSSSAATAGWIMAAVGFIGWCALFVWHIVLMVKAGDPSPNRYDEQNTTPFGPLGQPPLPASTPVPGGFLPAGRNDTPPPPPGFGSVR